MRFLYGEKNLARVLDEAEFWKRQESEHTVVIRQIVPNLEPQFVGQLQQFQVAFQQAEGMVVKFIETIVRTKGQISPFMQKQITDYGLDQLHPLSKPAVRHFPRPTGIREQSSAQQPDCGCRHKPYPPGISIFHRDHANGFMQRMP